MGEGAVGSSRHLAELLVAGDGSHEASRDSSARRRKEGARFRLVSSATTCRILCWKEADRKLLRMCPKVAAVPGSADGRGHGERNLFGIRRIEENTCSSFHDCVEKATGPEHHRRATKGSCLQRGEAVVLEGGGDDGGGVLIEAAKCGIVDLPQESNVGAGDALDLRPGRAVTHDHESGIGHRSHRLRNDLHVLIWQESGDAEEISGLQILHRPYRALWREAGRGIQYFRFQSVGTLDRLGDDC